LVAVDLTAITAALAVAEVPEGAKPAGDRRHLAERQRL
jgi:hypothetical protein